MIMVTRCIHQVHSLASDRSNSRQGEFGRRFIEDSAGKPKTARHVSRSGSPGAESAPRRGMREEDVVRVGSDEGGGETTAPADTVAVPAKAG